LIFDRRPYYLIAFGAVALVAAVLYFALPRVTAEQRVLEQLAIVAQEPWVRVQVQAVEPSGSDQVLVDGVRLDTGAPVRIDFVGKGPYTSESTMRAVNGGSLVGQVVEVKMLPLSLAQEPYRSQHRPGTSHVGVALYAGVPADATATSMPESIPQVSPSVAATSTDS